MCNLSQGIEDRALEKGIKQGIEQGIEKGIEKGIEQGRIGLLVKQIEKGRLTEEEAAEDACLSLEEFRKAVHSLKSGAK